MPPTIQPISTLPAAGALGGLEPIATVQGGVTKRTTPAAVAALAPAYGSAKNDLSNVAGYHITASAAVAAIFSTAVLVVGVISATAASPTSPEIASLIEMTSDIGDGIVGDTWSVSAYKMCVGAYVTLNAGSASGWAFNGVVNLTAGAGNIFGVVNEADINVSNQTYSSNGAPYAANYLATGTQTGANYAQAAFIAAYAGAAPLWNYGVLLVDYAGFASAFVTAAISDQSKSPTILHSNTAHANGIDFSGATFSGFAIQVPGFTVNSTGDINARSANLSSVIQAGALRLDTTSTVSAAGTLCMGNNVQTTVGAAGSASALPGPPLGYLSAFLGPTAIAIPYFHAV